MAAVVEAAAEPEPQMQPLSTLVSSVLTDTTRGVTDAERRATDARLEVRAALERPGEALVEEADVDRAIQETAPGLEGPPETLLRERLPEETVRRYLESWDRGPTAVRPGEVYLHPRFVGDDYASRFEALEDAFEVEVGAADLAFRGGVPFLTRDAIDSIREVVATRIGERRKETLAALGKYGLPRPVVEHMDVDVRLAFDEGLRARAVDATGPGDVRPAAIGGVSARIHFESEEVR